MSLEEKKIKKENVSGKVKLKFSLILIFFFSSIILLYRFLSWGFMMKPFDFLNSLTIPSFFTLCLGILAIFIDIEKTKQLFRLKLLATLFERTKQNFYLGIFICTFITLTVLNYFVTPPKWKSYINVDFLSGIQEDFTRHSKLSKKFDDNIADILDKCVEIFKTRERFNNNSSIEFDLELIRANVNALNRAEIPNNYVKAIVQFSLAEAHSVLKNYDLAISYYDGFLSNKKYVLTKKWIDSAYLNKGNIEYYEGRYKAAIDTWSLLPESPEIFTNIASGYTLLKEYNKGLDYINEGIRLIKDNYEQFPATFNNLIANKMVIYIINNQLEDAKETYNLAKEKIALDRGLNAELILIYLLLDDFENARNSLDEFSKMNKISEFKYEFYYGLYFILTNNHEIGIEYLKEALKLNKESDIDYVYTKTLEFFVDSGYENAVNIKSMIEKIKTGN